MRIFYTITLFVFLSSNLLAKTYIREYTYNASEADSKFTSRIIALDQIKVILLQEIGTYIQHEINITKDSSGKSYASENIKAVTAGLTKVKILKEEWTGDKYYLKAEIETNTQQIAASLKKLKTSNSEAQQQLEALKASNQELNKSRKEIARLRKELKSANTDADSKKAAEKYIAEIKQFSLMEMWSKGFMYHVSKDYTEAVYWYLKAAEQGHVTSQFVLRSLFIRKEIPKQYIAKVISWFHKTAEQGNAGSQDILGTMYFTGNGVDRDENKAAYWAHKAAEQGEMIAQYQLSMMYMNGIGGLEQDNTKSIYWLVKAAEQGLERAQSALAVMYMDGNLVKPDANKAIYWLRKAAEQGNNEAKEILDKLKI